MLPLLRCLLVCFLFVAWCLLLVVCLFVGARGFGGQRPFSDADIFSSCSPVGGPTLSTLFVRGMSGCLSCSCATVESTWAVATGVVAGSALQSALARFLHPLAVTGDLVLREIVELWPSSSYLLSDGKLGGDLVLQSSSWVGVFLNRENSCWHSRSAHFWYGLGMCHRIIVFGCGL